MMRAGWVNSYEKGKKEAEKSNAAQSNGSGALVLPPSRVEKSFTNNADF